MAIQEVLYYIGKKLNDEQIIWGVGGSVLLKYYGLAEDPRDIDIFVALEDIHKADAVLKKLGEKRDRIADSLYHTDYFLEYVIHDVDVDIMSGLNINHETGVYCFEFQAQSVTKMMTINGVEIPLSSLEDWYVIYQLLRNREEKAERIEKHLLSSGLVNTDILERSLTCNLPKEITARVETLLQNLRLCSTLNLC